MKRTPKSILAVLIAISLATGAFWIYRCYRIGEKQDDLATQLRPFCTSVEMIDSNVVSRCADGVWLGRVRFADDDWAGVAHHSRHTPQSRMGDITVLLTSDGKLHAARRHYCKSDMVESDLAEIAWSNREHFVTFHFHGPIDEIN